MLTGCAQDLPAVGEISRSRTPAIRIAPFSSAALREGLAPLPREFKRSLGAESLVNRWTLTRSPLVQADGQCTQTDASLARWTPKRPVGRMRDLFGDDHSLRYSRPAFDSYRCQERWRRCASELAGTAAWLKSRSIPCLFFFMAFWDESLVHRLIEQGPIAAPYTIAPKELWTDPRFRGAPPWKHGTRECYRLMGRATTVLIQKLPETQRLLIRVRRIPGATHLYPLELSVTIPIPAGGLETRTIVLADGPESHTILAELPPGLTPGSVFEVELRARRVTLAPEVLALRSVLVEQITQQSS